MAVVKGAGLTAAASLGSDAPRCSRSEPLVHGLRAEAPKRRAGAGVVSSLTPGHPPVGCWRDLWQLQRARGAETNKRRRVPRSCAGGRPDHSVAQITIVWRSDRRAEDARRGEWSRAVGAHALGASACREGQGSRPRSELGAMQRSSPGVMAVH